MLCSVSTTKEIIRSLVLSNGLLLSDPLALPISHTVFCHYVMRIILPPLHVPHNPIHQALQLKNYLPSNRNCESQVQTKETPVLRTLFCRPSRSYSMFVTQTPSASLQSTFALPGLDFAVQNNTASNGTPSSFAILSKFSISSSVRSPAQSSRRRQLWVIQVGPQQQASPATTRWRHLRLLCRLRKNGCWEGNQRKHKPVDFQIAIVEWPA